MCYIAHEAILFGRKQGKNEKIPHVAHAVEVTTLANDPVREAPTFQVVLRRARRGA
jgi:hypothetical protein